MRNELEKLCITYGLGRLTEEPVPLKGGLMHRMFRVQTTEGRYCIKVLNPEVMSRPEALGNTIQAEKIAAALAGKVPVVAAKWFDGCAVLPQGDQYYMIFDFIEGRSIFAKELRPEHCRRVGELLGIMHAAKVQVPGIEPEAPEDALFDWASYPQLAEQANILTQWNQRAVEARKKLAEQQVISHRDMDPKNVMWQGERPFLIDWEAAGYVNPYQELMDLLSCWADDGEGGLDAEKFEAFWGAYRRHVPEEPEDWQMVMDASRIGMLGWLEYNARRALGLTGGDTQEVQLGKEQIELTLQELQTYEKKVSLMKSWL